MHPKLQQTMDDIKDATSGMEDAAYARHPEGKWSSAEVLEHLSMAFSTTAKAMQRVIESNAPQGGMPGMKQKLAVWLVSTLGYFPSGRKSPPMVEPKGMLKGKAALDRILADLAAMDAALTDCEKRFGTQAYLADHPVLGPLTVTQWRGFHQVHTCHHMKQVRALKQMAE